MGRPKISRSADAVGAVEGGGSYFASAKTNIEFFSSGCTMFDNALGGGWAERRVLNVVGDKSTGKTLVAMEGSANFLRKYENNADVKYKECEAAFDPEYAQALSIPMDRISVEEDLNTAEDMFRDIDKILAKGLKRPLLYIVDSLDALSDDKEMEREVGDATYGANKAKTLSEMFRKLVRKIKSENMTVMIISQVRDNLNAGMFGKKHTRSGGKALDFYASQVAWLNYIKRLDKTISGIKRPTGVIIRPKIDKNKVGLPFRECEFEITFGYGIEDEKASKDFLEKINKPRLAVLEGAALREAAIREWNAIETKFLPTRRKYG